MSEKAILNSSLSLAIDQTGKTKQNRHLLLKLLNTVHVCTCMTCCLQNKKVVLNN